MQKKIAQALIICLLLSLASLFLLKFLDDQRSIYLQAKRTYSNALEKTQTQLITQSHFLSNNHVINTNLKEMLSNSLKKSLTNHLRPAELDQINIYDENCHKIMVSSTKRKPHQSSHQICKIISGNPFWTQTSNGIPVLNYRKTIPHSSHVVITQVFFDDTWVENHRQLKEVLSQAHLTFGEVNDDEFKLLSPYGPLKPGIFVASLISNHFWYKSFPFSLLEKNSFYYYLPHLFILLALLLFMLLYIKKENVFNTQSSTGGNFIRWCKSLDEVFPDNLEQFKQLKGIALIDVIKAKHFIAKAFEHKIEEIRATAKLEKESQKKLLEAMKEGEEKDKLISELCEHESLAIQIKKIGPQLIEKNTRLEKNINEFSFHVEKAEKYKNETFIYTLKKWAEGIQQHGARKFLRSLYDVEIDDRNALENDLILILRQSQQFVEQLNLIKKYRQLIQPQINWSNSVVASWYGLTFSQDKDSKIESGNIIEQANALASIDKNCPISLLHNEGPIEFPKQVPTPIMLAALYHVTSALARSQQNQESSVILFNYKAHNQKKILTASLINGNKMLRVKDHGEFQKDLQMAHHLLIPYKISVNPIDFAHKNSSIAFIWQEQTIEGKPEPKKKISSSLGQRLAGATPNF